MSSLKIHYRKMDPDAFSPYKGSAMAAGMDLASSTDYVIPPKLCVEIEFGLAFAFPEDCYGRLVERSSIAKQNITVRGGVIEADFRGPVTAIMFNQNQTDFHVKRGDRVVQIICERYAPMDLVKVDHLLQTACGSRGFGSSGQSVEIVKPYNIMPVTQNK